MMPDYILIDGDTVLFDPQFGPATVVTRPGLMQAAFGPESSQQAQLVNGRRCCVSGDEAKVEVTGVTYVTPALPIPGIGTLKIQALAPNQVATNTRIDGRPVLLKGGRFIATLAVLAPAKGMGPAPVLDAQPFYQGFGTFVSTNLIRQGT